MDLYELKRDALSAMSDRRYHPAQVYATLAVVDRLEVLVDVMNGIGMCMVEIRDLLSAGGQGR